MSPQESPDLRGVARALDDLFSVVERGRASEPGSPRPPSTPEEDEPGPVFAESEDLEVVDILEGPLLDADLLIDQIAGPGEERDRVDPEEERRAHTVAVTASLAQAVDAFVGGSGDLVGLSRRIRDEAMSLREVSAIDPLVDAASRLVTSAPPEDPDHPALALGRLLCTPGVAAGLALRLSEARQEETREEGTRVCALLGEEVAVAVADALAEADDRSARRNLVAALVRMGDQGMRQAEAMVEDGRWFVVRNGVSLLGEMGGERAVEHLIGTLANEDPRVRRETILALAKVGGDGAALLVLGQVGDPDGDVRMTAARAAGMLGSDRAVKTLLGRLDEEEDEEVRQEVLRALGQLGDPVAVPAIEKRAVGGFFSRPPAPVRIAAYRALAAIGTPHAKSLVQAAAEDKDPEVRAVARSLVAGRV